MAVNIKSCEKCIHNKVCGIKRTFERYMEAANNLCINELKSTRFAADDEDIIVDVECKHYMNDTYTSIKADSITLRG